MIYATSLYVRALTQEHMDLQLVGNETYQSLAHPVTLKKLICLFAHYLNSPNEFDSSQYQLSASVLRYAACLRISLS